VRTAPDGDLVVAKLGGETLAEQHDSLRGIAAAAADHRLVVVHGGGRRLSAWLERLGIESRFEAGRRVTDDAALEIAVAILGGLVNAELVAALGRLGVRAAGLTGIDAGLIEAARVQELGRVGRVVGARPDAVLALVERGIVPVVAPLALDEDGAICNVNADEVAAGIAAGLGARLVLLTDTDGVRDAAGHRIDELRRPRVEALIADGTIHGGMIPKVRSALAAIEAGCREVVIADGRSPDALPRAIASRGAGSRIVA
jgi:acetylglutamate kinase